MVSGNGDYDKSPFNLATLGYRQPGSSFKIVHSRGGAVERRVHALLRDRLPADHDPVRQEARQRVRGRQRHRPLPRAQLRQRVQRPDHRLTHGDGHLRQQRLRAARYQASARKHRQALRPADGDPLADLHQPVDDPRRPQARCLGARHGPRLRDRRNGGKKIYNPMLGDVTQGPIGIDSISVTACACNQPRTITNAGTPEPGR